MTIPDPRKHLNFVYWMMIATEPLLDEASKLCQPDNPQLSTYFAHHRDEEKGHPEWMYKDLTALGVPLELDYRAAAITGSQYYLIRHVHPATLLGYSYVLESSPKPLEWVDAWENALGGPLSCVRHHCTNDPQHTADLRKQIDALPADIKPLVNRNIEQVIMWLSSIHL